MKLMVVLCLATHLFEVEIDKIERNRIERRVVGASLARISRENGFYITSEKKKVGVSSTSKL